MLPIITLYPEPTENGQHVVRREKWMKPSKKQPLNHTEYGVAVTSLTLKPDFPDVPPCLSFSIWKVGIIISIHLTGLLWQLQELMRDVCHADPGT